MRLMATWRVVAAVIACGLLATAASCQREEPRRTEQGGGLGLESIAPSKSPLHAFRARARAEGLEILEAAEDGRIIAGRRLEAPERASARLLYHARYFDEHGQEQPLPLSKPIEDARFAPAPCRRIALLDASDALFVWDGGADEPRRVDEQVFPGFAFSHSCQALAYSKGPAPELDAYRHDLDTGQSARLTSSGSPTWGFAFSPADQRLVLVDSREGFPCMMTMAPDGSALAKLTNRGTTAADLRAGAELAPFPDGRRPPLWSRTAIYVENAAGVHAFDEQGRLLFSRAGASDLHRGVEPGSVLFREGERYWRAP